METTTKEYLSRILLISWTYSKEIRDDESSPETEQVRLEYKVGSTILEETKINEAINKKDWSPYVSLIGNQIVDDTPVFMK